MPRTTSLSIHRRPADVLGHGKAPIWPLCTRRGEPHRLLFAVCLLALRLCAICRGPRSAREPRSKSALAGSCALQRAGLLPSANGPPIGWLCACAIGSSPALAAVRCDAGVVRCAVACPAAGRQQRPRLLRLGPPGAGRHRQRQPGLRDESVPEQRRRALAVPATCAPRTLAMRCAALPAARTNCAICPAHMSMCRAARERMRMRESNTNVMMCV
jgi:hypothetical protein